VSTAPTRGSEEKRTLSNCIKQVGRRRELEPEDLSLRDKTCPGACGEVATTCIRLARLFSANVSVHRYAFKHEQQRLSDSVDVPTQHDTTARMPLANVTSDIAWPRVRRSARPWHGAVCSVVTSVSSVCSPMLLTMRVVFNGHSLHQ
jgi:hypothetical protein